MTGVLPKSDGCHFFCSGSASSSSNILTDGVYKSSFCPERCAQKKAVKKASASSTLHPIKK
jgi:hypothetical protein